MVRQRPTQSILPHLHQTLLFSGYSSADLAEVARFSRRVSLSADEGLFREGEPCRALYSVVEGLVKLFVLGPDNHEKTVEFIEPGQTFAEAAMFSGQGYPVNAVALEATELVEVDAYSLLRYLRTRPELSWQMLAVLSRRTHQLVEQIRSVSLHSAEQRVAAYLLANYDPDEPDRPVGHVPGRRAELASRLGLTTETLCRVVANFRRQGWIATPENRVIVGDPDALRAVMTLPRR